MAWWCDQQYEFDVYRLSNNTVSLPNKYLKGMEKPMPSGNQNETPVRHQALPGFFYMGIAMPWEHGKR